MENVIVSHVGSVAYRGGEYIRTGGTTNWKVWPIAAFDPPIRVPVGQIRIDFSEPIKTPYVVVVSAVRIPSAPLMSANCGDIDENGFVVHLWETIADRTLENGDFNFAVYQVT